MAEIAIQPVSEESLVCFFYGFTRNAGLCYQAEEMKTDSAHDVFVKNSLRFTKKLAECLKTLTQADIDEICWELDWSIPIEKFTHEFWKYCKLVTDEQNFDSIACRMEPVRPFTKEMWISYFIGLSWIMHSKDTERSQKLFEFYKRVNTYLNLNLTSERIHELDLYFHCVPAITDIKEIAIDIFKIEQAFGHKKR